MLTTNLLTRYNHILATTVLYLTILDPLKELANVMEANIMNRGHQHSPLLVMAKTEEETDYYKVLGVDTNATKHDIHKAFRQLAKKYHPDKNKDKGAQDEFIKIFKAYETLSDEKKRKEYDNRSTMNSGSWSGDGWHTKNSMNDFDIHEFFKHYEDQFLKHSQFFHEHQHSQHHQDQHQSHHERFTFHGVDLDSLFHDIDEDEYYPNPNMYGYGNSHNHQPPHVHYEHHDLSNMDIFGDGASFFGPHFSSQIHNTIHEYHHQANRDTATKKVAGKASYSCQTVTKNVNGIVMTQTSCM